MGSPTTPKSPDISVKKISPDTPANAWTREHEEFRNPDGTATPEDMTPRGGTTGSDGGGESIGQTPGYNKGGFVTKRGKETLDKLHSRHGKIV